MLSKVLSCTVRGFQAVPITVELDVARGLPRLTIVGLGDAAVRESRERVLAALRNSGYRLPPSRVTINLAPADMKKEGSSFDLPIALGILGALKVFDTGALERILVMGELSLTGEVKGGEASFPAAVLARNQGLEGLLLPAGMASQAALVSDVSVFPARRLSEVVEFLRGSTSLCLPSPPTVRKPDVWPDMGEVKGQTVPRRALEIAAAGGHNLLFSGPPGSGKTMLARRLPGILPELKPDAAVEVTAIHSVAGLLHPGTGLVTRPPFRSPHHTVSGIGLAGGGNIPRPGEVTLAHHGILFLDEMSEFKRSALEILRQPMEDGRIVITRAGGSVSFPADFLLVGATNPCPCGYLGHETRPCLCLPSAVHRYRKKISGPLLDRIDLVVDVREIPPDQIASSRPGEPSSAIRERVASARAAQEDRGTDGFPCLNAQLTPSDLELLCPLSEKGRHLLKTAVERLGLTARGYHRILKVARTIADLDEADFPDLSHLAEAIQYRPVLGEDPVA